MNPKTISLFLGLTALFIIVPIAYSIRYYFDRAEYDYMGITIGVAIFFILVGKTFLGDAFKVEKKEIDVDSK